MRKRWIWSFCILLGLLALTIINPQICATDRRPGEEPKPQPQLQPQPQPLPQRPSEGLVPSCSLSINKIYPRQLFTTTDHLTVSYNLYCNSPAGGQRVPVKIALYINNILKMVV